MTSDKDQYGPTDRQGKNSSLWVKRALSKADGGQVEMMTDEGLEKRNLDPDAIEQFRKELEQIAGDNAWILEVVEIPGEAPEIRGIVDDGEGDGGEGSEEKFFKEEL
ncbi:hypothetical protein F5883DRAFT_526712 [Diaporthe sp. PMI_573]|nr:hypothetical protein F5883DRAFT_526712 [Diaporthaceae sp. PMI_573]